MDELPPDVPHDTMLAGAAYTERLAYFGKKARKIGTAALRSF